MDRNTKKVLQYISDMEKQAKQMSYVKHLKKEVNINAFIDLDPSIFNSI